MMRSISILALLLLAAPALAAPATQPSTRPAALGPALITMHLKDVHPKLIFTELANQSGAILRPLPAGMWEGKEWAPVSIDLENVSFWNALKEITAKTGLYFQRGNAEQNLSIVAEDGPSRLWTTCPTSQSGQFLFALQSLDRVHRTDFVADETTRQVNLRLLLFCEPKVKVLRISQQVKIDAAVDELGNKLAYSPLPDNQAMGISWGWSLIGRVSLPANAGSTIAKVSGSARLLVQTQSQVGEIADIQTASEVPLTVAGHKLVVKSVRARGETYTVNMIITRDPMRRGGWGEVNLSSTFRMVDANGLPLSRRNYGGGGNMGDSAELSLMFGREDWNGEGAGAPAKLIWEVPTKMEQVEVPFVFEDVPLPW